MVHVHTNLEELPQFSNAVITIGTFDGVHTGHRKIIGQLIKEAKEIGCEAIVITFDPHPRRVLGSGALSLINTRTEKLDLLTKAGVDHIVEVPFTREFANQTPEAYIKDFLVDKFHPKKIIIGYDHKFGQARQGDMLLLEKFAPVYNFSVIEIPEQVINENKISSTAIRNALMAGDVHTATAYLGYSYFFSGTVVEGNKLGRTLGYPTANLQVPDDHKLIPANGVYAVDLALDDKRVLKGMMNIGVRPTIGGTKRVIEVHIFDFDEDIYGDELTVYLKKHIRNEQKFNGLEELKAQLSKDKLAAQEN